MSVLSYPWSNVPQADIRPHIGMKAAERKRKILEAAVRVFAREGYERTSIAKVCAEATIARGTLYQYFKDKRALFREVLENFVAEVSTHMKPLALSADAPIDAVALEELLAARFSFILETIFREREAFTIVFTEALAKNAETEDLYLAMDHQLLSLMTHDIRLGNRLGAIEVADPELAANLILGGIIKTAVSELLQPTTNLENGRPTGAQLARKIARLVAKMLR